MTQKNSLSRQIKLLSKQVYSQIAAGEVVDRPSSVIRELLDNSIDASATQIHITYNSDNGHISITDNGIGIYPDDLELAIVKHATSKIEKFEDIYSTLSLGFRGEALASIASVSKLKITSCQKGQNNAYTIETEGGEKIKKYTSSHPIGTTIEISDLFFNVPARKKFLKSNLSERGEIKKEIIKHLLSTRFIGITYNIIKSNQSKQEIHIPANYSLKNKIYKCFGADITDHLTAVGDVENTFSINIQSLDKNQITVTGYITSNQISFKNRRHQYFFIRGRCIENSLISSAFSNAYMNVIPPRTFGACFLYLHINSQEVDINVHPSKKEVAFSSQDAIYYAVYKTIKKKLHEGTLHQNHLSADKSSIDKQGIFDTRQKLQSGFNKNNNIVDHFSPNNEENNIFENTYKDHLPIENKNKYSNAIKSGDKNQEYKETHIDPSDDFFQQTKTSPLENNSINVTKGIEGKLIIDQTHIHILGQIANMYIVFTLSNDLYIADQHALQERIFFDEIKEKIEKKSITTQPLLSPFILELNTNDKEYILERRDIFLSLGIEIELFGEKVIKINKIPHFFPEKNQFDFLKKIIDQVIENKYTQTTQILEKMISTLACRKSIMAGDPLNQKMIGDLITQLFQKNYIHNCPHGRPFIKKISKKELDRFFDR